MIDPARVTLDESIPLVHALVAHVAAQQDVRVLLIKGPGLAAQGLRSPRISSDVDVLCDPERLTDLAAGLESLGWRKFEFPDTGPRVLDEHAAGYVHDYWPCGIDLHHWFPGFLAPHQRTFEALWDDRATVELATQPIPTCGLAGAALVNALHLERNVGLHWAESDRDFLVAAIIERWDRTAIVDLADLAARTGAADTLAEFLDRVDAPRTGRGTASASELDEWRLLKASHHVPAILWVEELRRTRLTKWPAILGRALSYTHEEDVNLRDRPSKSRRTRLGQRAIRVSKALRFVPTAIRQLVRLRRGR